MRSYQDPPACLVMKWLQSTHSMHIHLFLSRAAAALACLNSTRPMNTMSIDPVAPCAFLVPLVKLRRGRPACSTKEGQVGMLGQLAVTHCQAVSSHWGMQWLLALA